MQTDILTVPKSNRPVNKNRYFGSHSLRNTIIAIKENYPDSKIDYITKPEKNIVTISFSEDNRKKYKLNESTRSYIFKKDHLILGNGYLNPFTYDDLDKLIEKTEINYETKNKLSSISKTRTAIANCVNFYNTTKVTIGNYKETSLDIKFILNDIPRAYHLDINIPDAHMKKIDENTVLENSSEYLMSEIDASLAFKILKTTHPGLLTTATEYIAGLRDDKEDWKEAESAYTVDWKNDIYKKLNLRPLDIALDVLETICVGEYTKKIMHHLILSDNREYAYNIKDISEIEDYHDYISKRDNILNTYKSNVMVVYKETSLMPEKIIEKLNVASKIPNAVCFGDIKKAIMFIKKEKIANPLLDIIQKVTRKTLLENRSISFVTSVRKKQNNDNLYTIDVSEYGKNKKIDIQLAPLKISKPYIIESGMKRKEFEINECYNLTKEFYLLLLNNINILTDSHEYKFYKFSEEIKDYNFEKEKIDNDGTRFCAIYKSKSFPLTLKLDIYSSEIDLEKAEDVDTSMIQEAISDVYEKIYN